MKIWLINQNNMPPEYGNHNRNYNFAKYLNKMGHEPTVFVGSYLHNTKIQMIKGRSLSEKYQGVDFPYYFVKTLDYSKSRFKRVLAMFQFYRNLAKVVRGLDKPDAIVGSSPQPFSAISAIRLGKRYGCQSVVEIRDLWPESFLAYGILKRSNLLLKLLYAGEKWIYSHADKIVFTMEGGRDYIIDKGWDKEHGGPIDLNKVYHINNGVDLDVFDVDLQQNKYFDADIEDKSAFKVVYAGSIGKANNLDLILDAGKYLKENSDKNIKLIIFGDGYEKDDLIKKCERENIDNVVFKGSIEKKFIPYILSRSNLNILNYPNHDIWKYGGSQNKIFDYLASGKPVLSTISMGYDIIKKYNAGLSLSNQTPKDIGFAIISIANMNKDEYNKLSRNARIAACDYDFNILTKKLINIIEG